MHEVLVNGLGGLSLPRKSVVRLIDRPDMTLDVYRGRKTTMQQCNTNIHHTMVSINICVFADLDLLSCSFEHSHIEVYHVCLPPLLRDKKNVNNET